MNAEEFDMIVIGGGSAGYAAARTARESWEKVAIIDSAAELGGLCILRGCMPSKTLIYSAEVMHLAKNGKLFGLKIPEVTADMPEMFRRKLRMVDEFQSYRQGQLLSGRFTLIRERATFIAPDTVELLPSGRRLTARAFVIATGSVVNVPKIPGLDSEGIWNSDDVLDLDFLPESLVMLGGGVVACELAQFLQRIGCKVTLIQRGEQLLTESSETAGKIIGDVFRAEGMDVFTGTSLDSIEKTADGFRVRFQHAGGVKTIDAKHVCNALGRRANTSGIGLTAAGVETHDDGRIRVDAAQRTANPKIYAAGDVCGPFEIVHLGILQGELAARHARGENPSPLSYTNRTMVIFTDPQIATAGISADEARAAGIDVLEAEYPFDDHGKSILMEARHGRVKIVADRKSGRMLGAECIGKDAGELIHAMAVAVTLNAKLTQLAGVQWYHPTLAEIWSYPIEDLLEEWKTNSRN